MSRAPIISGAYVGVVLITAGVTHYVSVMHGAPIGPGIALFVATLPSSLVVFVPPLDALEAGALTAFLIGCGAIQAGTLWFLLK
ncbi:SCO4225 family membrane protein [Nonomuraea sp. NPDC059023]|uniref:SCO4225 family membrane protein n=1 Tax=unclassified Nonomuraea TaxID=2593643 RepID=UPI003678EB18